MPWDGRKFEKALYWIIALVNLGAISFVVGYFKLWGDARWLPRKEITAILEPLAEHASDDNLHMPFQVKQEIFYMRREGEALERKVDRNEDETLARLASIEQTQKEILALLRKQ